MKLKLIISAIFFMIFTSCGINNKQKITYTKLILDENETNLGLVIYETENSYIEFDKKDLIIAISEQNQVAPQWYFDCAIDILDTLVTNMKFKEEPIYETGEKEKYLNVPKCIKKSIPIVSNSILAKGKARVFNKLNGNYEKEIYLIQNTSNFGTSVSFAFTDSTVFYSKLILMGL